jgi:hypothetical protein
MDSSQVTVGCEPKKPLILVNELHVFCTQVDFQSESFAARTTTNAVVVAELAEATRTPAQTAARRE